MNSLLKKEASKLQNQVATVSFRPTVDLSNIVQKSLALIRDKVPLNPLKS